MTAPANPSVALVFGAVAPPQGDVVSLFAHLGCSKEVSSFEVKLQNWNGKYSPSGAYPITVGMDGSISLGRGATCPLLMTLRVEDVNFESTPTEHYVTVSGRCWGEKLFRYTVTKSYAGWKGEDIVKNLMDYYAGLSHVRSAVELVANTSTTYTNQICADSPAWDILKYIAETADLAGVIGFDFRVAPDGKFEFFAKLSKINNTTIIENIDKYIKYRKNITRVRNKITIYGLADKSSPAVKADWTRSLTPADGDWTAASGDVSVDATGAPDGGACIKLSVPGPAGLYFGKVFFTLDVAANTELYPVLDVQLKLDAAYSGTGTLTLWDATSKAAQKSLTIAPDAVYHTFEVGVGSAYANQWEYIESGFDWTTVKVVFLAFWFPETVGIGNFRIHQLYFGGRRYSAIEQNATSQAAYGIREYTETDEELWSDNECDLRAKALLVYLKDIAEYLTLVSTLLDYSTSPILGGDKVLVTLPNEGITNTYYRVESVEYRILEGQPETLEITLELGKVPPQMADYIYGLRTFTVNVEKLSRTKAGRRGSPVATGGGAGSGSYFVSNVDIDKVSPVLNLMTSRVLKACIGFDGVNFFVVSYTGDLILRAASHVIRPYASESDALGSAGFPFSNAYFAGVCSVGWLNVAGFTVINSSRELVNLSINAGLINLGGTTEDIAVAKVGGGTRTLHFQNSRYTGYTDS